MQVHFENSTSFHKFKDFTAKIPITTAAPTNHITDSKRSGSENSSCRLNNSTTDTIRCTVTSERLSQLRKYVDDAVKEHKTFTIKGGWQTLRNEFIKRGWVEKIESTSNSKQKLSKEYSNGSSNTLDEVFANLPTKQEWESQAVYINKCEKTIMSRMLQSHSVDFYWNMRRETTDWHHRVNTNQTMNRFHRSLFTSKEGLNLLLQQMYWYYQPGVASVSFPRCYTLGFADHYSNFVDDFRMTACISMLKWYVAKYEKEDEFVIRSPEGRVPHTALEFALDRCNDYIASQKHLDLDRNLAKVWDYEWDQFLSNFYLIVHEKEIFLYNREWSIPLFNAAAKTTLNEIRKYWPMMDLDGMKNIWILKPGNKCRGRGIQLVKYMEDVTKIMGLKIKYVVQKYIERPLLIYDTKFDIRQWFMVTSVQPLIIWMYRESYLRFSTQIYSLDNFHESFHLTNHAVQCKYTNVNQRNKALPVQNMWNTETFKNYLNQIDQSDKWDHVIYPGMRENIIGAMLACQDTMDRRPNTFELYGADFILAEDFKPWLLEINASPDLSPSTDITRNLCPQCLKDVIKVLVDKRRNTNADTGQFNLVYKQTLPRPPAYLGMSLSIRGHKIFKKKSKGKEQPDKENNEELLKAEVMAAKTIASTIVPRYMPKMASSDMYKGPVIGDLIDEIHQTIYPADTGYEFVPALQATGSPREKKSDVSRQERVSKRECGSSKNKTNTNNFANRKSNVKENCKITEIDYKKNRKLCIKSAYFNLCHDWKLKNRATLNSGSSFTNKNVVLEKDTSNILKANTVLSKFRVKNLSDSVDAKQKCGGAAQNTRCVSSVNLNLPFPQLHKVEPQFMLNLSQISNNYSRKKSQE